MYKDNDILDVVAYLFQSCLRDGRLSRDTSKLTKTLQEVGFQKELIYEALAWLASILQQSEFLVEPTTSSTRMFNTIECSRLTPECRQFLSRLEEEKILNPKTREVVIQHMLYLNHRILNAEDAKLVALIVLYGKPEEREKLIKLEQLVFSNGGIVV